MSFLLSANVAIAAVFLVAGLSKIGRIEPFRQTLAAFALPPWAIKPLAIALPIVEIVVAVGLLWGETAFVAAAGAAALLASFSVAIAHSLKAGRTPDCNCFGRLRAAPITWSTWRRTTTLALCATAVAAADRIAGPQALDWAPLADLSAQTAVAIAAGLLLSLVTLVVFQLARQNGRLLTRIEALEARLGQQDGPAPSADTAAQGLAPATPAPFFQLQSTDQGRVSLPSLLAAGRPLLLVFSDPDCGPCEALMPMVATWQRELAAALTIAVISRGGQDANLAKAASHGLKHVLIQQDREVAEAYLCFGTPGAVLIGSNGLVASGLATGGDAIAALVAPAPAAHRPLEIASNADALPVLTRGMFAPDLKLRDIDGRQVAFKSPGQTLVLFWNPSCGFCQQMLHELRQWETSSASRRALVFSSGAIEEIRAMGLRSQMIHDPEFRFGQMFAAAGTPSAVLLDADGRVISEIAAGRTDVMALANGSVELQRLA